MQARGLKPFNRRGDGRPMGVAPHAGAWIETVPKIEKLMNFFVAPHAGAWIETRSIIKPVK